MICSYKYGTASYCGNDAIVIFKAGKIILKGYCGKHLRTAEYLRKQLEKWGKK